MEGDSCFTLDELCTQAAFALSIDYDGPPNDRIRDIADRRTVRYYTTLGLIDRPVVHGRIAYYGRRQLLQLVAIKRLQSVGLSLQEIQKRLLNVDPVALEAIARVPSEEKLAEPPPPEPEPTPRRGDFWKQAPSAPEPSPAFLQGLPLQHSVVLLAPLRRAPDDADLEALRIAAAPLLRLLEVRRLIAPPSIEGDTA